MRNFIVLALAGLAILAGGTIATPNAQASNFSRHQALNTAHNYLSSSAFSRKSLIEQLEFEHYSRYDSIWAVNRCGANWMAEAVEDAREYLMSGSFSRQDLFEQLEFEGFTPAQAAHGVYVAYR